MMFFYLKIPNAINFCYKRYKTIPISTIIKGNFLINVSLIPDCHIYSIFRIRLTKVDMISFSRSPTSPKFHGVTLSHPMNKTNILIS